MFKHMTIGTKLLGALLTTMGLSFALLVLLIVQARQSSERIDLILHRYDKKLSIGAGIQLATVEMKGAQRGLMLSYEAQDEPSAPQYIRLYENSGKQLDSLLNQLELLADGQDEKGLLKKVRQDRETWAPKFQNLIDLCKSGEIAAAYKLRNQNKVLSEDMLAAATQLVALQRTSIDESEKQFSAASRRTMIIGPLLGCLTIAIGFGLFWVVRHTVASLRQAVEVLFAGTREISGVASQTASSAQSLACASSEQAASIEKTSASTHEAQSTARSNADRSRSMAELVAQSQRNISQGDVELAAMVRSMDGISNSSAKISKIIKVIDEIAFQTNILSLNAAVEAARAGEAGLGFAVVADEVRNLAHRSAQAAHETASLIQESIHTADEGKAQVNCVVAAINCLNQNSSKLVSLVNEVAAGSEEQDRGLEQIARAIVQMEQVTQTNAANAEQGAAAAEELNAHLGAIEDLMENLDSLVNGSSLTESEAHSSQSEYAKNAQILIQRRHRIHPSEGSRDARIRSSQAKAIR